MFKINIMQIMKFITAVVCFSLFGFAVYSMNQSKASPLPFLICACIKIAVQVGALGFCRMNRLTKLSFYLIPTYGQKSVSKSCLKLLNHYLCIQLLVV